MVEKRSDETDNVLLTNEMRDLLQQQGRYYREATTSDATPVVLWAMDIARDTTLWVEAVVLSHAVASGNAGASWRIARFKNVAGVGASGAVAMTSDDYDAGGVVALARAGVTLTITITGVAAVAIDWHARVTAMEVPWARV